MPRALRRNADGPSCHPGAVRSRRPSQLSTVLELLQPGSFVWLLDQPRDLPPFQLLHCRGGRCWVRQQSWGPLVHWEVAHWRLSRIA
ncbi:MAG: hypothetical protein NTZ53_13595 [Cyanobacteria bacterium]|nr:hypothetical protein [Cyanobacteriota bacterium]